MGTSFSPYLHFHGNAAEAMATYGAIFGGSPDIVTFGQFGGADPAIAGQVMHSSLRAGPGLLIMASDTPSEMGGGYDVAGNTSVAVISDGADPADDATLTGWWDALSDGATIHRAVGGGAVGRQVRHAHRPLRRAVDVRHHSRRHRSGHRGRLARMTLPE